MTTGKNIEYNDPVKVADGIFWVGFRDPRSGLQCNPYLLIESSEAILFDSGSRTDFSTVMMRILQTGINPDSISRLIYHHSDPDLCASIPHFENMIKNKNLKIISHAENHAFIRFYSTTAEKVCISALNNEYKFSSGRTLKFLRTPYSHSAGSFVTFDEQTGVLLSSDIFGSYGGTGKLFLELDEKCHRCDLNSCALGLSDCPLKNILDYHRKIMTSEKALRFALKQMARLPIRIIAPQHGSIVNLRDDIKLLFRSLMRLKGVGIDGYALENPSL